MSVFPLVNTLTSQYDPGDAGVCYERDQFYAQLSARDPESQPVSYFLISGSLPVGFSLDPLSGVIEGTGSLVDIANSAVLEKDNTWVFSIGAYDGVNPPDSDPQQFSITVKHIPLPPNWGGNDGGLLFTLWEGDAIGNATIQTPSAVHIDSNGLQLVGAVDPQGFVIDYTIGSGSLPSGISMDANGVFTGTLPPLANNYIPLGGTNFPIVIFANNGVKQSTLNCSIEVYNKNVPPTWHTGAGSIGSYPEFSPMSYQLVASDVDGNNLTYSIISGSLEQGVTLSPSGLISGTPVNPNQGHDNTCNLVIGASNPSYTTPLSISVTFLNVNLPPVWQSPGEGASLADNYGGTGVSAQCVGTDPQGYGLSFSVVAGGLPPGVGMNSAGTFYGTLPVVGSTTTYYFTVGMSNGIFSVNRDFNMTAVVLPDIAPVWQMGPGSLGANYNGSFFAAQLSAYSPRGNPISYYVSGGGLPGLSMSSAGYISGTLETVGSDTEFDFTVVATDGQLGTPQNFSITVYATPHGTLQFTSDGGFQVPGGVTYLNFDWIVGGGGAGGGGMEQGNGGGGGGGGSGGWYQNAGLNVNPGDEISIFIGGNGVCPDGEGGAPYSGNNGSAGGDTVIQQNGNEVFRSSGGGGGQASENYGGGYVQAPGGAGGSPNGNGGDAGQAGTSDRASAAGGNGGSSPLGSGGGGGNTGAGPQQNSSTTVQGSAGAFASGYGAGGGGAGMRDRASPLVWYGGYGTPGFVQVSY